MTKKDIKIAIFSAFAGIMFTAIYDLIKSKPILSTLWNILKLIWTNVFEFKISIWQILLGIIILIIIFYFFSKQENNTQTQKFTFKDYNKDKIHNMTWSWYWEKDPLFGKWRIEDLKPICDSCGTKMKLEDSYKNEFANCPRCGNIYFDRKDLEKIEAVIIDNVQRGLYLKDN